ncbi:hypothetical protein [Streptomyces mesophilus]
MTAETGEIQPFILPLGEALEFPPRSPLVRQHEPSSHVLLILDG